MIRVTEDILDFGTLECRASWVSRWRILPIPSRKFRLNFELGGVCKEIKCAATFKVQKGLKFLKSRNMGKQTGVSKVLSLSLQWYFGGRKRLPGWCLNGKECFEEQCFHLENTGSKQLVVYATTSSSSSLRVFLRRASAVISSSSCEQHEIEGQKGCLLWC